MHDVSTLGILTNSCWSSDECLGLNARSSVTVDFSPKTEGNCLCGYFYSQYLVEIHAWPLLVGNKQT